MFGDVAGHFRPFKRGLRSVGVDVKNLVIPDDLVVVQVGDLVHKGPNSGYVVELVDKLMRANPGRWIQLAGNHELPYVMEHGFFYPDRVDVHTMSTLASWRRNGLLHAAYSITSANGEQYLVTHAGLTEVLHRAYGGGDAHAVSRHVSSLPWKELASKGVMFNGGMSDFGAGIFWAEGVSEVYASWVISGDVPPFHQIHGHSSSYLWEHARYRYNYRDWIVDSMVIDRARMHSTFNLRGKSFYAIDHGLGAKAFTDTIWPLVIE